MKRILISGANGLIGHELVKTLCQKNKVYAISRKGVGIQHENVTHIGLDFDKPWDNKLLPSEIDVICHLAQSENFREFPEKGKQIFNVNTSSTVELLNYAVTSGCKKFIYASSGGIYGNSDTGFNEEDPITPGGDLGFYLSTKFCSEILVENYNRFFETSIIRFFFVYGQRQRKNMFIPRIVNSIKEGLPITLQGKEGIKVNPIHVSDAALAVESAICRTGSFKVNVGGSEVLTLKSICESIGLALNIEPKFIFEDKEPKHLIGDINKMKKLLIDPSIKFDEGIKELL